MYKRNFAVRTLFFLILVPLLFACTTTAPMAQPPTPDQTASQVHVETDAPIPTASPSLTHRLTSTLRPTKTPTPSPTVTATFDVGSIKTRTPAPPAQCPIEKPEMVPAFEYSSSSSESVGHFYKQVLDFLNAGGTRQAVISAYLQHLSKARAYFFIQERNDTGDAIRWDSIVQERDITGDGIPDLLLTDSNTMDAFVCQNGQYQGKNLIYETYHFTQPVIADIKDMNLDGVDEIIAIEGDERIRIVIVLEWDGNRFQPLNLDRGSVWNPLQSCSDLLGPSWAYAQDTDNNGTLELVLKQGIPIGPEYGMGLPWRKETRTCTWNGTAFVLTQRKIDTPPEYRFQAVQDGDLAARAGKYDQALSLYQQAIFSDVLQGWSQAQRNYEQEFDLIPTPRSTPIPDPAEYANHAAYARFRVLLLHVVQGYLPEAETVYSTLQEQYPEGRIGHAYAEMAAAFWNEYQKERNIGQACAKAVDYAIEHPTETLSYLGNGEYAIMYFGDQSLEYKPEDLCPFR